MENRELSRGTVGTIVLKLLSERTMYGYEIIKEVEKRTGGEFIWKEGTLYPALHKLEQSGLIASSWELASGKPRKYYAITGSGAKALAAETGELKKFVSALNSIMMLEECHEPA